MSLRKILVPSKHGSWGFLLEPILLALIVAPSGGGSLLALGVIAAFGARHPARLAKGDLARGARLARTRVAMGWAIALAALAGACFGLAAVASGPLVLAPLALAAGPAYLTLRYDFAYRGRELPPELLAPSVLAAAAPAIVLAGGWAWPAAAVLWLLLVARQLPAVLYVRARLRLDRGEPATRIGFAELAYGALSVARYAAGYLTGWKPAATPPAALDGPTAKVPSRVPSPPTPRRRDQEHPADPGRRAPGVCRGQGQGDLRHP